jgi:hypothetical protein
LRHHRHAKREKTGPGHWGNVSFDAGKRVKGRKRLVLIDTLGDVLASRGVPAHVSAAIALWDEVANIRRILKFC